MGSNGLSTFLSARWKRRVVTAVVVRRRDGKFLVQRQDDGAAEGHWRLPGGVVKTGQSPRAAAGHDLRVDLGLDVVPGRVLVMDFGQTAEPAGDSLTMIFDGGTWVTELDGYHAAGGTIQARFITLEESGPLLGPKDVLRLRAALDGLELLSVIEMEDGRRVDFEETPGPRSGMILMPELDGLPGKVGAGS